MFYVGGTCLHLTMVTVNQPSPQAYNPHKYFFWKLIKSCDHSLSYDIAQYDRRIAIDHMHEGNLDVVSIITAYAMKTS